MSVENATAFYEVLVSDRDVYEQYCKKCSQQGVFGVWNWDKTKIVNFAAKLGFDFTEVELDQVWFETEPDSSPNSMRSPTYSSF
ncbi:MAG: Nif11-like leader peptide family natural product precursor [Mastigocoleus sp. MO_167.B18]|uniref:Nif11-like leader peptide family natural product precursor n=1 Tax=Mastigocoleus sp. MO_188.B34 TaxID=3036635 RepID=UPI0026185855|nr:Nif11-like leader peptide family natural product precursor [Mastigocoleus sp. MO_188.B34]MDJ0695325.1 Nif11-like leader peptide family natural product precursor [Mastigocoleus sp. MO_188.B34]MDJ0772001.1 Nif11-like leader peptide family natural product precursor [Mastigocoleus sp. MO_167.B18]